MEIFKITNGEDVVSICAENEEEALEEGKRFLEGPVSIVKEEKK